MFTTRALPGFGMEIEGIDISNPLEDNVLRSMLKVFHENGVILIRNQTLGFEDFDRLTRMFGAQKPHFLDHLRLKGHPAILMLSNIVEDGNPVGVYEGAGFWHTDVAYEDPPNSSTIVYGREWPEGGCPTYFADMYAAYAALPDAMKKRIDSMTVLHHYGNRADMDEESDTSAEKLTDDQKARVKNVFHPLVRVHPFTGRKALYGVAGSSFGIVGMPDDEAIDLLDELKTHALQPRFTMSLDFHPGDVGAWDTYSTLHKATVLKPATGPRDRRLLWRISVTGAPPALDARQR